MFVNKHFAYPWRYKREILYLHGISKVSISQEVKGVIKRNLPYIIFYVMTNTLQCFIICINASDFFFSTRVFFHEHSQFTWQQGKGEGTSLVPLYHFHPLHGRLSTGRAIAAGSSPQRIASSWTRTENLSEHK